MRIMKLIDLYRTLPRVFSFEFFPPKTREAEFKLFETVRELESLQPSFVSVTYGAMGTTRDGTLRLATAIKKDIGLETAAHLTCVGHTREELEQVLEELHRQGVENLVVLRGDPPQGTKEFRPPAGGFRYAGELVAFIRSRPEISSRFSIAVAGYPEGHMETRDRQKSLEHLKWKIDCGADVVITQLFFDNQDYFDFADRAAKAGIRVPLIPGIMPLTHAPQIQRFAEMCGARIPEPMKQAIERYGNDEAAIQAFGIDYATRQCEGLLRGGVRGLHFYTLNRSRATREIYLRLGLHSREERGTSS